MEKTSLLQPFFLMKLFNITGQSEINCIKTSFRQETEYTNIVFHIITEADHIAFFRMKAMLIGHEEPIKDLLICKIIQADVPAEKKWALEHQPDWCVPYRKDMQDWIEAVFFGTTEEDQKVIDQNIFESEKFFGIAPGQCLLDLYETFVMREEAGFNK